MFPHLSKLIPLPFSSIEIQTIFLLPRIFACRIKFHNILTNLIVNTFQTL